MKAVNESPGLTGSIRDSLPNIPIGSHWRATVPNTETIQKRAAGINGDVLEADLWPDELRAATPSSLRFMVATVDLRGGHCDRVFRAEGWISDQDSLIAMFSRMSACIDFSFDFWRLQGIASRRSGAINEAGGRSGDRCRIKEPRPRAWHRLWRVTQDQSPPIPYR